MSFCVILHATPLRVVHLAWLEVPCSFSVLCSVSFVRFPCHVHSTMGNRTPITSVEKAAFRQHIRLMLGDHKSGDASRWSEFGEFRNFSGPSSSQSFNFLVSRRGIVSRVCEIELFEFIATAHLCKYSSV